MVPLPGTMNPLMAETLLRRQLELTRYDRALEVSDSLAAHRALLTTLELARLNLILLGRHPDDDPWRQDTVTLKLPSGKEETLTMHSDPKLNTRDRLHRATEIAEAGDPIEAAVQIYSDLVRLHAFEDGNRRTAALAANFFLRRYGVPVSGTALHELGLGDIRDPEQLALLKSTIEQMARFAASSKNKPN